MKRIVVSSILGVSVAFASFSCSSKDDKDKDGDQQHAGKDAGDQGSGGANDHVKDGGAGGGTVSTGGAGTGGASSGGKTSSTGGGGVHAGAGDAGEADGSEPPDGGGANEPLPTPVLCPETDPFHPTNPNSVVIDDVELQADTHWTADKVYLIGDDFKVEHHTLTVDPGTMICLYQFGRIIVGEGIDPGEIHLDGTADKPIVITTTPSDQDPSQPSTFHGGLQMDTYLGSSVSHVNIWYGGPGGGRAAWGFELTDTAHGNDATKPLLVDHVTVGQVQAQGVRVGTSLGVAAGSSIRFTGFVPFDASGPPLNAIAEMNIRAVKSFNTAFDYSGAPVPDAAKHVNIFTNADGRLDDDAELDDIGLPYLYKNHLTLAINGAQDGPGVTLTLHEGVNLRMSGALIIGTLSGSAQGDLIIEGTAAKPVVLTSAEDTPAAGDWEGLLFVGGQYDPKKSKMDHAQILYAGVDTSDPQQVNYHVSRCGGSGVTAGAVMILGSGLGPYDGPSITNTLIAHSASDGICSDSGDTGEHLATDYTKGGVTFQDIAQKNLETDACP